MTDRDLVVIVGAQVFDGVESIGTPTVTVADGVIAALGAADPVGRHNTEVVDGRGCTLLPGLVDAHVHPTEQGLRQAVSFGVTTVIEMGGAPRGVAERIRLAADDSTADLLSAGVPLTAECGHPNQLFVRREVLFHSDGSPRPQAQQLPGLPPGGDVVAAVRDRIAAGSDFIKVHVEDGTVLGEPDLPLLEAEEVTAAVDHARACGKMSVAHALTYEAAKSVLAAGVDGLSHIFLDRSISEDVLHTIIGGGVFVIPCLVINRSILGHGAADLAADPRVSSRLDESWLRALRGSFNTWSRGRFEDCLTTVAALHAAGVPLLAGTDSARPDEWGVAQGASLHEELALLVLAGLAPAEALRAATSAPAQVFGLHDRGRIRTGARADLLLVEGNPCVDIGATLSTRAVWRRGTLAASAAH